jgi:hypothetical protein
MNIQRCRPVTPVAQYAMIYDRITNAAERRE